MSATNLRIFISRLQGLPVLDSAGDQVGKVRDVVVQLHSVGRPARVKGMVVELFARRRIFIPMIRVHDINVSHIAIVGVVDTRRFHRRDSDTLVIEDLLDRNVTWPDGRKELIFDLSMRREVRSPEWELVEVALQEVSTRRFGWGNKASLRTVDWPQVAFLLAGSDQGTDRKLAELSEMNPADVARELHDMDPARRVEVASGLDDEQLADAFQELPEDEQVSLLQALDQERAADVLGEMDPDDAADLINELPTELAEDLLRRMEPDEAADVRNLMRYEEYTAGGMMTPDPVIVAPDATVADALARARTEKFTPATASMVFVCRPPLDPPTGRYVGGVHIQRLLREPPSLMASNMMDDDVEPLPPEADLYQVSRYFATYNLVVAPVVNENGQLIGAVTVDDVIDHMLPDDWRGDQLDGEDGTR